MISIVSCARAAVATSSATEASSEKKRSGRIITWSTAWNYNERAPRSGSRSPAFDRAVESQRRAQSLGGPPGVIPCGIWSYTHAVEAPLLVYLRFDAKGRDLVRHVVDECRRVAIVRECAELHDEATGFLADRDRRSCRRLARGECR